MPYPSERFLIIFGVQTGQIYQIAMPDTDEQLFDGIWAGSMAKFIPENQEPVACVVMTVAEWNNATTEEEKAALLEAKRQH